MSDGIQEAEAGNLLPIRANVNRHRNQRDGARHGLEAEAIEVKEAKAEGDDT